MERLHNADLRKNQETGFTKANGIKTSFSYQVTKQKKDSSKAAGSYWFQQIFIDLYTGPSTVLGSKNTRMKTNDVKLFSLKL